MSDSRTQSVCKHCRKSVAFRGNYWLQVETNGYLSDELCAVNPNGRHEAEPVAEPASTGEQPPKIDKWINSAAMEIRSWVWRTTSKWVSPSAIEELIQVSYMCEAALPSEPSAPPVELPGPTGEGSSGHSWIEPAPQTSAAPQLRPQGKTR